MNRGRSKFPRENCLVDGREELVDTHDDGIRYNGRGFVGWEHHLPRRESQRDETNELGGGGVMRKTVVSSEILINEKNLTLDQSLFSAVQP
jgi:hypothetical protein